MPQVRILSLRPTRDDLPEGFPAPGYDTRGKYARAKASFVVSSGFDMDAKLGGMVDPHMQPTYYLIAHNTYESQYDSE